MSALALQLSNYGDTTRIVCETDSLELVASDTSAGGLLDLVHVAVTLLEAFPSKSLANLLALNAKLRACVHRRVTHISLSKIPSKDEVRIDLSILEKGVWPQLTSLDLSNLYLVQADVAVISRGDWPSLTKLDLHNNCESVTHLIRADWPHLRHLNLSYNGIGNKGLAVLSTAHWPLLESLHLRDPKGWDIAADQLIKGSWPSLKTLDLRGGYRVGPTVAASLTGANWPWLEKLDLHIYGMFSNEFCKEIAKGNWPNLQTLYIQTGTFTVNCAEARSCLQTRWPKATICIW